MILSPFPAGEDPRLYADYAQRVLKRTEDLRDEILLRGAVKQYLFSDLQHP